MSTFGEIVEPSSRSVWEDWDEVNTSDFSRLQWEIDVKFNENFETLLILEGKYLAETINITDTKINLINSIPEVDLKLYKKVEENIYICIIKEYNLVQSSEIIELLKNIIMKSNNVISIITKPLVEFQSTETLTQGVIRSLSTSKPLIGRRFEIKFPKLEQPNMISGVSAGVVWLREILGLPALAVVFYQELAEEHQTHQLKSLLESFNIVTVKNSDQPVQILSSNLYI